MEALTAFKRKKYRRSQRLIGKIAVLTAFNRKISGVNGIQPEKSAVNGVYPEKSGVNDVSFVSEEASMAFNRKKSAVNGF